MQKRHLFILITTIVIIAGSAVFTGAISGFDKVEYPIAQLGNCQSKAECRAYCDESANADQCLGFALQKGLMSSQEIEVAKKFLKKEIIGPGACNDKESCQAYCDQIDHIDECVAFAQDNNLLPPAELQEFKQVQSAIKKGIKLPACENKQSCELYCEAPEHMEECIQFGAEAGFLEGEELQDAKKMLQAIKKGLRPPACRGREACQTYCSAPENMEGCMNFAIEAGFMTKQEKAEAQKILQAIKNGVKPPSCEGREECDAYCALDEHFDECFSFAESAGFISQEEAVIARKTKGRGPGGCKGRQVCEAFCQNPDNQETCFAFAKDNGMMSEEDSRKIEKGKRQFTQGLQQAPPEVLECLNGKAGLELVEKMKSGYMPSRELGEQMSGCFQQMSQQRQNENHQIQDSLPYPGCKTQEECAKMRMMQEERMRQEMMGQQNSPPNPNYLPQSPPTGSSNQDYQRQYEGGYQPQQQPQYDPQYQQQQELYKNQAPLESPPAAGQPSFIGKGSVLGSLLHSLFNFLFSSK